MNYTIEDIGKKAIPIAKKYGVRELGLFGSYAKGEANDESDVDFYINKGRIEGLFQYFSFVNELEEELKCHVDVVTTGIEDKVFLEKIMREGVRLYAE